MKVARWLALAVWALVAASAVAWAMKLFARPLAVPAHAQVAAATPPRADLTRLFGVDAPPPPVPAAAPTAAPPSTRFQLIGVAAPRGERQRSQGVALIAIDGKPPRAFRVGAVVDGDQVLQSVQQRGASLGPRGGASAVSLELPALPPPSVGVPQPAAAAPAAVPPVALPPPAPPAPFPPRATPTPVPGLPFGNPAGRLRGLPQVQPGVAAPMPFGNALQQAAGNGGENEGSGVQNNAAAAQR